MRRVERYSNWCEIDQLDGKELRDGEWLWITWPDRLTTRYPIKVVKGAYEVSDMGHPYSVVTSKAYVEVEHHGLKIDAPILGLEAMRTTRPE